VKMAIDFLEFELEAIVEGILPYIPNIIFILVLLVGGYYINILINHSFRKIIQKVGRQYGITLSKTTIKIVVNVALALLIIINIPGVNESILQLLGVVVAGIIAFSSSTIIANFMSGIIIKIGRIYKSGDIVKIDKHFGEVAEVNFISTILETPKKELMTVPNQLVMLHSVTNYSHTAYLVNVSLSLGYDVNRIKAEELLIKAAKACNLKSVFISLTNLNDFSVSYEVNGELTDAAEIPLIESALRKAILDEFNLAGIEILSPDYRVTRTTKGKAVPKGLSRSQLTKSHKDTLEKARKIEKATYAEAERIRKAEERKILKGQFQ